MKITDLIALILIVILIGAIANYALGNPDDQGKIADLSALVNQTGTVE